MTVPLLIAVGVITFSLSGGSVLLVFVAVAFWGIGFGSVPTASQTWISRAEPRRVEAAGGLVVATFQPAIALGAALGGVLLDTTSVQTVFLAGGVAAVLGGGLLASTRRLLPASPAT